MSVYGDDDDYYFVSFIRYRKKDDKNRFRGWESAFFFFIWLSISYSDKFP